MENPVAAAIQIVGGPTEASHICRVSVNTIHTWRRDRIVRDARAAVLLHQASGIPVAALAGLEVIDGNGGDRPTGRRFPVKGGPSGSSATYHDLSVAPTDTPPPVAAAIAA